MTKHVWMTRGEKAIVFGCLVIATFLLIWAFFLWEELHPAFAQDAPSTVEQVTAFKVNGKIFESMKEARQHQLGYEAWTAFKDKQFEYNVKEVCRFLAAYPEEVYQFLQGAWVNRQ